MICRFRRVSTPPSHHHLQFLGGLHAMPLTQVRCSDDTVTSPPDPVRQHQMLYRDEHCPTIIWIRFDIETTNSVYSIWDLRFLKSQVCNFGNLVIHCPRRLSVTYLSSGHLNGSNWNFVTSPEKFEFDFWTAQPIPWWQSLSSACSTKSAAV